MEEQERKSLTKWLILMMVLLLLVVLVSVRLTQVTVKGNSRYTAEEVESMVFQDFWDRNTAACFVREHFFPHKRLPFIEDYDIQFTGLFSCDLVVYEKSIVGYVRYMSSNMYFDKDGVIVESSQEQLPDVPEVSGLSFGHIVLNEPLPVQDEGMFGEIMNVTQQLNYYGIPCRRLEFDSARNIRLTMAEENIEVELGRDNIETKISVLSDMLPQLSGKEGTLDLSDYDETQRNHVSSFRLRKDAAGVGENGEI